VRLHSRLDDLMLIISCFTLLHRVEWTHKEGSHLSPQGKLAVAQVYGKARKILLGERTALNILCRCSGIALR
jgi:nicotinate-nucleotide pyrophosphorylase (carboxylating)